MYLQFHGAADGVTGSLHRIQINGQDILLDCGLFQGHRAEANARNRELPEWAKTAAAVVLSHAHLDHSGNLPSLVKAGYQGNIYCTPATRDLCSVMLRDAAMLQEQDARYINRRNHRDGQDKVEALYTVEDAHATINAMISVPPHRRIPIANGVTLEFYNAGHVLGSSLCVLDLEEKGRRRRLLFSGDLGRGELPLLDAPEIVDDVNFLILESTYGDRQHSPPAESEKQLASIVTKTIARGGRVYIPTFALERAQEILYALKQFKEKSLIPDVPIFIDSPLAVAVTEIYKLHPGELHDDICEQIINRDDPFAPRGLTYVTHVRDSQKLQGQEDPCIIIAGSGMCEGGRIVHHFVQGLGNSKNSVVIVGFMAQHTLGRRLIEGRSEVRVLGVERDVRAEIHALNGLSAHADSRTLNQFTEDIASRGRVETIALVHGEDKQKEALAKLLKEHYHNDLVLSKVGEKVTI